MPDRWTPSRDRGRRAGQRHRPVPRRPRPAARARSSPPSCARPSRTPGSCRWTCPGPARTPGVAAVIGPDEVRAALRPFPLSTGAAMPYLPTAVDKVRFVGEPIAVVVASDRYTAEDAAELVAVDYEPLDVGDRARGRRWNRTRRCCTTTPAPTSPPTAPSPSAPVDDAFAARRARRRGGVRLPALLLGADGVLLGDRALDRRRRTARPSRRGRTSTGPFTMVPVMAGALRHPDVAGAAARARPTSAAASGSRPASTPTSC